MMPFGSEGWRRELHDAQLIDVAYELAEDELGDRSEQDLRPFSRVPRERHGFESLLFGRLRHSSSEDPISEVESRLNAVGEQLHHVPDPARHRA